MNLAQELRFAARRLLRRPALALLAIALLAVGLGGNLALLSVLDAILFRQPPVEAPDRLVRVLRTDSHRQFEDNWSFPTADDLRRGATTLDDAAIYADWRSFHLKAGTADGVRVQGSVVTGNYFHLLGARPAVGRLLTPDDDRADSPSAVVVLAYDRWRTEFGADPGVVGSSVVLNGQTFSVVGVAPPGLTSLDPTLAPQLWIPISAWTSLLADESRRDLLEQRGSSWLDLLARLTPGTTVAAAQAELDARLAALAREHPDTLMVESGEKLEPARAWVMPLAEARIGGGTDADRVERQAALVAAVGGLVLLVVAANLAALLAARATQARYETAVRAALGASRLRLAQPLLLEGTMLAAAGAIAALPVAAATAGLAQRSLGFVYPLANPAAVGFASSPRVALLGLLLMALTVLLVGALPGAIASRFPLVPALRREDAVGAGARLPMADLLIGAQLALSVFLLMVAALLVGRFRELSRQDPHFDAAGVIQASYDVGLQGYDAPRASRFHDELLRRAQAALGDHDVALTDWTPLAGGWSRTSISPQGFEIPPGNAPSADVSWVSPQLFEVLGIRLEQGRLLAPTDRADSPSVALINDTMARRYFAGRDPVGSTFRIGVRSPEAVPITVVGVVADARYRDLLGNMPAMFFRPLAQRAEPPLRLSVVARSDRPDEALATLRRLLRELDPQLPLYRTGRLEDQVARSLDDERRAATLFSAFAALVLVIAAAGLGALALAAVGRRRREIGIRLALGARSRSVVALLLRRVALLVAAGMGGGLALASFLLPRVGELAGTRADVRPFTILVALGLLTSAAMVAAWIPLRKALAIEPAETLRAE